MSDDATAVIRRMVEAFNTGDTSSIEVFVADNYRDHQGLRGSEIAGSGGFRQVVQVARGNFDDLRVSIEDMIADGDRVAVRLRWSGRHRADGVLIARETIDIVGSERGQAVEHWGIRTWVGPG